MSEKNCKCAKTAFGRFGSHFGDKAWDFGANLVKKYSGYGDYELVSNSLIGDSSSGQPIVDVRGRATRVAFREYLGDVYTASSGVGDFNMIALRINPADAATFPWLSSVARQYEQYVPNGIIIEFKATASDNSAGTSVGSVIMSTDYDVLDFQMVDKRTMLNSAYSSESKQSNDQLHGIECDPNELQRKLFYTSAYTPARSQRDYDLCYTYIATQGGSLPVSTSIGSIYVHYDFTFYKETIYPCIPERSYVEFQHLAWTSFGELFNDLQARSLTNVFGNTDLPIDFLYEDSIPAYTYTFGSDLSETYWMVMSWTTNVSFSPTGPGFGIHQYCEQVQTPVGGYFDQLYNSNTIAVDNGGAAGTSETMQVTFIKINKVPRGSQALFRFSSLGWIPSSDTNARIGFQFRQIPMPAWAT